MCGICGIVGRNDRAATDAMVTAMHHRGPDDAGTFADDWVSLGMARLAILDTSPRGHQPMHNAARTVWLVYNGETFNFQDQRRALEQRGHEFASSSDSEVVLHLYEEYGDDFLTRMNGMFALAIYDRRRGPGQERLVLARDPLGIKPLLWTERNGRVLFASEIKALLASGLIDRSVDPESLRMLLATGSVPQPATVLAGVHMLLPGHRLVFENGRAPRNEPYWRPEIGRRPELARAPYPDQVAEVGRTLDASVRAQMVSDVPLGAFLSGGVDSSLLVALMARHSRARVRTFSVGFESEGGKLDESADAERAARLIGTDHTRVLVTGAAVRERIEHIAAAIDQPTVDGVNSYFVSAASAGAVKVAISGTGGDELFAGYPWFVSMARFARRRHVALRMLGAAGTVATSRMFDPLIATRIGAVIDRVRSYAGFLPRYARLHGVFGYAGAARMLGEVQRSATPTGREPALDLAAGDPFAHAGSIERVSGLVLRGYLQNQLLRDIDAVSMAHSLEVRVPLLDVSVVDTALSLPSDSKLARPHAGGHALEATYRATGAKRILVDVGRGLVPRDLDVQKKRGFTMPFAAWMRGPLRDVLEDTLAEGTVRRRGLFMPAEVSRTRTDFLAGDDVWSRPWLLMMCELWCRRVLDATPGGSR